MGEIRCLYEVDTNFDVGFLSNFVVHERATTFFLSDGWRDCEVGGMTDGSFGRFGLGAYSALVNLQFHPVVDPAPARWPVEYVFAALGGYDFPNTLIEDFVGICCSKTEQRKGTERGYRIAGLGGCGSS